MFIYKIIYKISFIKIPTPETFSYNNNLEFIVITDNSLNNDILTAL